MEEKFTVEEFAIYLDSQDSRGDIHYFLSAENIRKAVDEASKSRGELLADLSCEFLEFKEFKDYVNDYYESPSYEIDEDSDYFEAITDAYNDPEGLYEEYCEYFKLIES